MTKFFRVNPLTPIRHNKKTLSIFKALKTREEQYSDWVRDAVHDIATKNGYSRTFDLEDAIDYLQRLSPIGTPSMPDVVKECMIQYADKTKLV